MKYKVEIREYNFEEVVREVICDSLGQAERVERGVNINLNHDEYFTNIVEIAEEVK